MRKIPFVRIYNVEIIEKLYQSSFIKKVTSISVTVFYKRYYIEI